MAVIKADDINFKELIGEHNQVIVKYYADWCGSCRLFAPKYKRLSTTEGYEAITFLEVNAEESPEARKTGNVHNLPCFAIYKNGNFIEAYTTSKEEAVVELLNKLKSDN